MQKYSDRDSLLTPFGQQTLKDRYVMPGEDFQDMFQRVSKAFADDEAHAQRVYDYMSKLWFMPATPVLSNGGTTRGLPISCFLNHVYDSMTSIQETNTENFWLACKGGGIGTYWGDVRSMGEKIGTVGKSSGIVPFLKMQDAMTLAVSQGNLRRASSAVYLPVWHPEIEEFIEIRRPSGGDPNRKTLNLHHGVVIDDAFMEAVKRGDKYHLRSPHTGEVVHTIQARDLWIRILIARMETGEPYILYIDHVNKAVPDWQKKLGYHVNTSNLCSEIVLHTGKDRDNRERTAVCCLSSLNIETYDDWKDHPTFICDIMRFLDNVLQNFIDTAGPEHGRAVYAAIQERSVGLGVMGLHGYFQSKLIAFDSDEARDLNKQIFQSIHKQVESANETLAVERGPCPDAKEAGVMKRFTHCMAIAPTASISIIAGNASPGIEPLSTNAFTQKTLSGSFLVKNQYLTALLQKLGLDTREVWSDIILHEGSVQHLPFLTDEEKAVFKTAFEVNQEAIVRMAGDRAPFIDQAQSLNLFLKTDVHKKILHRLHFLAWELGVKSLYYCRSTTLQRAEGVTNKMERNIISIVPATSKYEECQSCQ